MKMTYDQYIVNPMGIKNSVYSNRELYRNMYKEKLNKVLLREVGRVKYKLYKSKKSDEYLIYMKVPSEVIKDFYYDVLVKFYSDDKANLSSRTLKDYKVKFFSNDPSFVFTFAHAMVKNDMFLTELKSKMSKEALSELGKTRNPKDEIGYVKSLYFCYLIMKDYNLFEKIKYENEETLDIKKILSEVEHSDKKIADRQEAQDKLTKTNKKKEVKVNKSYTHHNTVNNTTKIVKTIRTGKVSRNTNKSKFTSKVKKF